jgi:hypothetical protein
MAFDVESARKEGYSDADIAGYLAKQRKFDLTGARKEGYSDADVISHLTKAAPKFTPREATPADIPGAVPQPKYQEPSMTDRLLGLPETAATIISGGASGLAGQVAGIFGGKLGQGPNVKLAEKIMQAGTYRPTGEGAQANLQSLGAIGSALPGFIPAVGQAGQIAQSANVLAARATPAINALRNEAQMIREFQPFPERAARLQQERITQSFQNAPQIEAAQAAQRLGVAIPPAISNPTKANKIVAALTGSPEARMARKNEPQWTEAAKKDMGLPPATTLDRAAFDKVRSSPEITKPYEAVASIRQLTPDEQTLTAIEGLRTPALIGGESSARAVSELIVSTIKNLNLGLSGSEALTNIRNLRQSAQTIYNAQRKGITPPSPESISVADASMAIANQLEELAAQNLTGTQARAFQNARTLLAKTYDYERATDFNTGRIDPTKLAAMAKQKPLTGTAADIASVAANFPTIAEVKPGTISKLPTLARGGTAGTLGFGLGSLVGFPAAGGVIGATGGMLANALMARRMSTPAYQAANAMPPDYRPPVNALRPVEPGASNLAMFNPQSAVLPPEYTPNFIMPGQPQQPRSAYEAAQQALREEGLRRTGSLGPDMQFAAPRELPMPGAEGPVQERIYNYARDKAADEAAAAAAQRSPRQSAGAGVSYELDPFTGKLQPVGQQVKGPETFTPLQENVMMRDLQYVEQLKEELKNLKGSKNRAKQNEIKKEIQEIEFFYADKIPNFLVKRGRNQDYGSSESFTPPSGLRNITPQSGSSVVSAQQTTLDSAIEKLKRGAAATLTAEEKIILRSLQNQNQLAP